MGGGRRRRDEETSHRSPMLERPGVAAGISHRDGEELRSTSGKETAEVKKRDKAARPVEGLGRRRRDLVREAALAAGRAEE